MCCSYFVGLKPPTLSPWGWDQLAAIQRILRLMTARYASSQPLTPRCAKALPIGNLHSSESPPVRRFNWNETALVVALG